MMIPFAGLWMPGQDVQVSSSLLERSSIVRGTGAIVKDFLLSLRLCVSARNSFRAETQRRKESSRRD
jgi:hypothetical protein